MRQIELEPFRTGSRANLRLAIGAGLDGDGGRGPIEALPEQDSHLPPGRDVPVPIAE
jgi:hypothetical protein